MALAAERRSVPPRFTIKDDGAIRMSARRIGIIGGGAAGLGTARVFLEENKRALETNPEEPFTSIVVLERSNDIGGVWNYTSEATCHYNIPQDTADRAIVVDYDERDSKSHGFPTPVYDELNTNLPKDVMQFPDLPFPSSVPEFPDHRQVRDYVHAYADKHELRDLVQLNTEVRSLKYDAELMEWKCRVQRLDQEAPMSEEMLVFDAVVICTGRVSHPHIPDVPGLQALAVAHPGSIIHAKEYRRASDFANKDVLVVGGASSGSDISRQLSFAARSVHLSVSDPIPSSASDDGLSPRLGEGCSKENQPVRHPRIKQIMLGNDSCSAVESRPMGRVVFVDGSEIPLPDTIIYATGYLSVYPYIHESRDLETPNSSPTSLLPFTDGHIVNGLYKYLVYINNPTLGILGIPFKIVPFPLYEYQALYLSQLYQGNLQLPSAAKMRDEWETLVASRPRKQINEMGMGQVEYQNEIVDTVHAFAGKEHRLGHVSDTWIDRRKRTFELRRKHLGY
ncbi:FAD/NAD(P)-binding domain-containing protein [Martensiomyces pterosporus]|nr:FAD/NAD(P)-binding domain-containing protein [Martensiomyces pterosporus]